MWYKLEKLEKVSPTRDRLNQPTQENKVDLLQILFQICLSKKKGGKQNHACIFWKMSDMCLSIKKMCNVKFRN